MKNSMTDKQFQAELTDKGFTFCAHRAMSGSEYWTINGNQYRMSDHLNPHKPVCLVGRIECMSYERMLELAVEAHVKSQEVNTTDEWLYDSYCDGFYLNENYIPAN
jgi:hypothetical protein